MLVLAPTRELAIQVSKDFKDITKKLSVHCFYGGSSYNPQGIVKRLQLCQSMILSMTKKNLVFVYTNYTLECIQILNAVCLETDLGL